MACVYARRRFLRLPKSSRTFFSLPPPAFGPFGKNIFGSADEGDPNDSDGTQKYHERKIMPYRRKDLYDLVADVDSYRHFVPFCRESIVLKSSRPDWRTKPGKDGNPKDATQLEAELVVGFLGLEERYVSKVECKPFESVQAVAATQTPLFKTLITTWTFQDASSSSPHPTDLTNRHQDVTLKAEKSSPTLLTFDIVFEFANPLHATVSSAFFGRVSSMMVRAFEERCLEVYGTGTR